ncbi:MAG: type II toxin-antitoxin system YafQ family toxin [Candidatus Omnitrophica bacterium]|nr:type II toxin-antitoxin system YafQ family toxin [Candidatus Omnitrophota bacterium]
MLTVYYTKQFKKDAKASKKRGKDTEKLKTVIRTLAEGKALPEKCRDHFLIGKFDNFRECHIEPDWLLIYRLKGSQISFVRTGTHSDLFG